MQPVAKPAPFTLRSPSLRTVLIVLGIVLLVLLSVWWVASVRKNRLLGGGRTWTPAFASLGVDFFSNYYASRHWLAGGNPYVEPYGDPLNRRQL